MQYLAERCGAGLDSAQDKAKAVQLALDAADISSEIFSKKGKMIEKGVNGEESRVSYQFFFQVTECHDIGTKEKQKKCRTK